VGFPVNASFRDVFVWILSFDLPSFYVIWSWLMNMPWWVALLTVYLGYQLTRGLIHIIWKTYGWLCDRSDDLGQRIGEWWKAARSAIHRLTVTTKSISRWLMQVLAIR
jgi:hypothetical protein